MEKQSFSESLKTRWGIKHNWEILVIIIVFSITGSLSLKVSAPILNFLGIYKEQMNPWIFWPLRILIVFPVYQILLIVIGSLLGQFNFFWKMEKKMLSRFGFRFKDDINPSQK